MSWADKAHKKIKAEKMAMEVMNSPRYREARKKDMQEATMRALVTLVFITLVYLEMVFRCKRKGLMNFVRFAKGVVIDFKTDDKWLLDSDKYYRETYDINVLDEFGLEIEKEGEPDGEDRSQAYTERAYRQLYANVRKHHTI